MMAPPVKNNNYCCSSPAMERKLQDLEDEPGATGCFAELSLSDTSSFRCLDSNSKDQVQRKGIFTSGSLPETPLDEDYMVRYQPDLGRTMDCFSWHRRATISSAYPATEALEKVFREKDWGACTSKRAACDPFALGFVLDSDEMAADHELLSVDLCKLSISESGRNLGKTRPSKRRKLTRTKRCAELSSRHFSGRSS
jgi:hypothetical protein